MTNCTTTARVVFDGTAALDTLGTQLVLIEGGRASREPLRPRTTRHPRPASLSAKQSRQFIVAFAVLICLAAALCLVREGALSRSVEVALDAAPTATVVVDEGDTLWSIASQSGVSGVDTSELVSWIERQNNLSSGTITPGMRLVVPCADAGR